MTCNTDNVAEGIMVGAPASQPSQCEQVTLSIGKGLKVVGCNIELDLCSMVGSVPLREPSALATIFFCDEQGIGKVKLSTLFANISQPAVDPLFTLNQGGNLI